ncbi:unnamed protein product, partial [marine sediment metagenome]
SDLCILPLEVQFGILIRIPPLTIYQYKIASMMAIEKAYEFYARFNSILPC